MTLTLAELTDRTGFTVLDHLDAALTIPVSDGLQAQGDLLIIPFALVSDAVTPPVRPESWRTVPESGLELLRSAAGGNPHSLVADPGTCRWSTRVADRERLALGMLHATEVAYLIHPEHGATGIAPGSYLIRRQRERANQGRTGIRGGPGSAGFGPLPRSYQQPIDYLVAD